jgi:hypothetical protein
MNDDMIADLKQFIVAAVRQELHDVARKSDVDRLDKKIDSTKTEILDAIGDVMSANTDAIDEQLADHGRRLTALEAKAA